MTHPRRQTSPPREGRIDGAPEVFRVPRPREVDAGLPAEGVLLTHEQSWIIEGTALGPLAHSVCLAPGEITQIAVRNQSRQVLENSVDQGIQVESTRRRGAASSRLDERERASASEAQRGSSTASSSAAAAEASTGFLLWSASGGSNLTRSSQASTSTGHRSVASAANQRVHQSARDQASLARASVSTTVHEVSESDSLEIRTRVLANYNHMHALTMQYFEVEQVYQLRTRVTTAECLLFVPMKSIDFGDPERAEKAIRRYREHIIETARDLGLDVVADRLEFDRADAESAEAAVAWLTAALSKAQSVFGEPMTTAPSRRPTLSANTTPPSSKPGTSSPS